MSAKSKLIAGGHWYTDQPGRSPSVTRRECMCGRKFKSEDAMLEHLMGVVFAAGRAAGRDEAITQIAEG